MDARRGFVRGSEMPHWMIGETRSARRLYLLSIDLLALLVVDWLDG